MPRSTTWTTTAKTLAEELSGRGLTYREPSEGTPKMYAKTVYRKRGRTPLFTGTAHETCEWLEEFDADLATQKES